MSKCFLFILLSLITPIACANTITLYCPSPQQIKISPQTNNTEQLYAYRAIIPVDLAALDYHLVMSGEGSANTFYAMKVATWTDMSFLCWYTSNTDDQVIFTTTDLEPYVDSCHFPNGTDAPKDECHGSNPKDCQLICNLK